MMRLSFNMWERLGNLFVSLKYIVLFLIGRQVWKLLLLDLKNVETRFVSSSAFVVI